MKLSIEDKLSLGQVLVRCRTGVGLTQDDLAEKSGVPIRTIQRAETGHGIGHGNLATLASTLKTSVPELLKAAVKEKGGSPELRLNLYEATTPAELIACLRAAKGNLILAPEGEHGFNEHIAAFLLEVGSNVHDRRAPTKKAIDLARYTLSCCEHMGFRLFGGHYKEELEYSKKLLRQPTTVVIAASLSDQRVRKTPKGLVLDYLADKRKEVLHSVLKTGLTAYDWLEDLYVSKLDGESRVRAELLRMHLEIRAAGPLAPRRGPARGKRR